MCILPALCFHRTDVGHRQWHSQPNILDVENTLTLREHSIFFWNTASQSTKRQDMLEILRELPS